MSERQAQRDSNRSGVIRASAVHHVTQPAWLTEGTTSPASAMTVVPILEHGRVAGIEVRCRCGDSVLIECMYEGEGDPCTPRAS